MKITRHVAPDMRQALRAVRERLGPDAVILSSRRTPSGVEVTAAMDFDAETLQPADSAMAAPDPAIAVALAAARGAAPRELDVPVLASAPAAASMPPAAPAVQTSAPQVSEEVGQE